jgi:hypothetical protein
MRVSPREDNIHARLPTALLYFCYWLKKLATFNPKPIFTATVPLQLLVTAILNVTKTLLDTTKSNQLCSETVTPLHFISGGHRYVKV